MDKKQKHNKKRQIFSEKSPQGMLGAPFNGDRSWDIIPSDVLGSYTGTSEMDPHPVQDADDL